MPAESTFACFEALDGYLREHGRPVAFYSDKHSIFRVAKAEAASGHGMTRVSGERWPRSTSRSCAPTPAKPRSSQAKGRVKHANRTLQDRVVQELRLEGISDMAAGSAFLPAFMARHNLRFARSPARPDDLHA